jgi:hypothetical protein
MVFFLGFKEKLNNLKKKVKGAFTLPESESKGILPD